MATERVDAATFCRSVQPRLVASLTLYCGDQGVAEELSQETLAVVWNSWSRVRAATSPEAYTLRIAFNQANSLFRRRAAERRAHRRLAGERAPAEPAHADAIAVREALRTLPSRQRLVLVARYFLDLSVADTALLMGCAPGTVKSLTHSAIASLRSTAGLSLEEVPNGA